MKKIKNQKNWLTTLKNEKGFTLLEALLALFITTICVLLMTMVVDSLEKVNEQAKYDKFFEWHMFLIQLENDVADLNYHQTITNGFVEWRTDYNQSLKYDGFYSPTVKSDPKMDKQLLIRREYNGGTNPILVHLDDYTLTKHDYGSVWTVTFENGEKYSAIVPNSRKKAEVVAVVE